MSKLSNVWVRSFAVAGCAGLLLLAGCQKSQPGEGVRATSMSGPAAGGTAGGANPQPTKGHTLDRLSGSVNCDCEHVDAGLLTGPYRDQCMKSEKELREKVANDTFKVTVKDDLITGGDVCDGVTQGPNAWPKTGGPVTPPKPASGPPCRYVGGIVQWECPK